MSIDYAVFESINGFAGQSSARDEFFVLITHTQPLKGVIPALALWLLWFAPSDDIRAQRIKIIATFVSAVFGILAGKVLALTLPFNTRPIFHNLDDVTVQQAFHLIKPQLKWASSMPSDHATMFFALATSIFLIHRLWGTFLLVHAIFVISLPRIYLGLHWPSDIFVGALVGILVALLVFHPCQRFLDKSGLADWLFQRERLLYAFAFLATYGTATMFTHFWRLAKYMAQVVT